MAPAKQNQTLSVVMPVHNALPHLDDAVRSILNQSYHDFEFVILDDGSTDGSSQRLREWAAKDERIKLVKSPANLGPAGSSNRVVAESSGQIIARMDADDVSHPDRLRLQLDVLNKYHHIGLVGALTEIINEKSEQVRGAEIWRLTRSSCLPPFAHGSIMYRRKIFEQIGGYRQACQFWEDQDLVLRFADASGIAIVPAVLYRHRNSPTSTRVASERPRVEAAVDLMYRCLDRIKDGRPYDDLLNAPVEPGRSLDPRVFVSLGSLVLWSGRRPRLLRRLFARGRLRTDLRSITAVCWAAWAATEPSSLRFFLKAIAVVKSANRRSRMSRADPIIWHPAPIIGRARAPRSPSA
jgi:glycosyltransferase involved in cell wall biosynthesis